MTSLASLGLRSRQIAVEPNWHRQHQEIGSSDMQVDKVITWLATSNTVRGCLTIGNTVMAYLSTSHSGGMSDLKLGVADHALTKHE